MSSLLSRRSSCRPFEEEKWKYAISTAYELLINRLINQTITFLNANPTKMGKTITIRDSRIYNGEFNVEMGNAAPFVYLSILLYGGKLFGTISVGPSSLLTTCNEYVRKQGYELHDVTDMSMLTTEHTLCWKINNLKTVDLAPATPVRDRPMREAPGAPIKSMIDDAASSDESMAVPHQGPMFHASMAPTPHQGPMFHESMAPTPHQGPMHYTPLVLVAGEPQPIEWNAALIKTGTNQPAPMFSAMPTNPYVATPHGFLPWDTAVSMMAASGFNLPQYQK